MAYVPVLIAIVIGVVSLVTMGIAFLQIKQQGGWEKAMATTPDGKWSSARRLMLIGAVLALVFVVFGSLGWILLKDLERILQ